MNLFSILKKQKGESKVMLYAERVEIILQQLQLRSTVKVTELSQLLHVSVDTVRRDLKAMEQEGLIRYIHGGACLPEIMSPFSDFTGREIINSEWKREASKKAISYIKQGNLIALNSGTTNTILAQELVNTDKKITVVTNNYAAIHILMQNEKIHLISIGGDIDSLERSSYGTVCESEFGQYYPDIAFLSINAVNCEDGYTDFRFHETGVLRLLAKRAKQVIAVMDSSKLDKRSKKKVLSAEEIDLLVMDDQVSEETKKKYSEKGILII